MPLKTLVGSLAVVLFILAGCVTPGKPQPQKPDAEAAAAKAGSKTQPGGDAAAAAVAVGGAPSLADQLAFVQRHTSPASTFDEKEHEFLAALPSKPEPGSVTEAALAVGIVKAVNNPPSTVGPSFEEQDIRGGGNTVKSNALSLESRCKERGLNLADAMAANTLLATPAFAKQVADALERHRVSDDFRNEIQATLRRNAETWAALSSGLSTESSDLPPAAEAPPPPLSDDAPLNPADLKGGDSTLAEAEALADRGDFKAAIRKAKSLPASSPMRATAQEKIKDYSNRGVQDLRRKAADAFQNARPVSDPRARSAYLQQAKAYLEEAIKEFPDATLLPTVRDNLRMITRDLEQLAGEKR